MTQLTQCLLILSVGAAAPRTVAQQAAPPGSPAAVSSTLREIAAAGQLPELRWPNFTDYRQHVQNFYQPSEYTPAWTRDSQPPPQALAIIGLSRHCSAICRYPRRTTARNCRSRANLLRLEASTTASRD